MSRLDDALRLALRREDPPQGFADRVLAAVPGGAPARRLPRWLAAAAALVMLAGGIGYEHERRLREGEQAKEKVMLALRITGSKLKFVKEKIHAIDITRR
jgi:hypothetical protein